MDFASPLISVEKNSVGAGVADGPKKMDGCGVKHEVVAHILMGIRGSMEKDSAGDREARCPPPPMTLYEYQNKRVTEKAFRKSLILKDAILVVLGWQRAELPV